METRLGEYRRARREFFERHGPRWPGTLADEFDILAPCALSRTETAEILNTVASLARIYNRTAELLLRLSDQALVEMGVPSYLLPTVRCTIPGMAPCVIGRFDLARTGHGYKMLEFNADVPGLLVEAFSVNAEVCRSAGRANPNELGEIALAQALTRAVEAGLRHVGASARKPANVVVTSTDYFRDKALAEYLCDLLQTYPAQYAPIENLGIDCQGLYDPNGNRIDVLYRSFPAQFMLNTLFCDPGASTDPQPEGLVFRLVEQRRLATINPPFSFLLQSKALQAVIWNLFESGQYFPEDGRRLIERYMLPTYLDPPPDNQAYVVKPVYGAEGDTVKVITPSGGVVRQSAYTSYSDQLMVYQKYVDLMPSEMMTEYGPRNLHVVTSCFLIAGKPSGICMRAGEAITDESAWVLPVCVDG